MGADIHAVVETDIDDAFPHPEGAAYVEWHRWTELFVALGVFGKNAKVPVRGFPPTSSFLTREHYALEVLKNGEHGDNRAIHESDALIEVENGASHFLGNCDSLSISDPAFSFPNWITPDELEAVWNGLRDKRPGPHFCFGCEATLVFMKDIASRGITVRLVYWFDV